MEKKQPEDEPRIGRPSLPVEQRAITGSLRLTPNRWKKLRMLGMEWLGNAIDKAKLPKE